MTMMKRPVHSARVFVLAAACLLASTGCQSADLQSGIRIGDRTLEEFEPGRTREAWVIAVLGEPTSTASLAGDPGMRVLRYATLEFESRGLMSSLLGTSNARNVSTIYFVVRDGVVERFWADRASSGGLFGGGDGSGEKQG